MIVKDVYFVVGWLWVWRKSFFCVWQVLLLQTLESSPHDCQRRTFCSRLAAPRCRCCFASRQLFERTLVPTIPLFFPSFYVQVVGLFGILNFPENFFGGKQNHSLPPSPPSSHANPLSPTLNLLPLSPPLWVSELVSEWVSDYLWTSCRPIDIQSRTLFYHFSGHQITTGGAYLCPVGSIWPLQMFPSTWWLNAC